MDDAKHLDIAAGELIDLELIRGFIVVAEELNFTRAAARLGLAQPPLSAAIGKLERKLGVRLLERSSAPGLAFVPVADLSPSEVVAAWPDTSRSRAVAGFVRAAAEVAASHTEHLVTSRAG